MPTLFEQFAARIASWHARRVYARFIEATSQPQVEQRRALASALALVRPSEFGRKYDLGRIRTAAEFQRAVPLMDYETLRPTIDRVCDGDVGALFHPRQRILMFATSSGTTAMPKRIPVTPEFVADYRRGWNTFGLKMLTDHPAAVLRSILQSSGRIDENRTASGLPCGAITGLLAKSQKGIVRRFYVGRPEIARISDARARYYTLMRLGITRDVAFAVTANPSTLIQLARVADEASEHMIRDVRDGTIAAEILPDAPLRRRLSERLQPDGPRAKQLEAVRQQTAGLRPRDYWRLEFLACWTGGSMGHYLPRVADWFGPIPIRDVGLLASEGRISIPLRDGTPDGVLDVTASFFEFIPIDDSNLSEPLTISSEELEIGREYVVVLTNRAGLLRYRLNDVVQVTGRVGRTPLLRFLHRAGRVASVAGEKLTEHQVVEAVRTTLARLPIRDFEFVMAPCWGDPPYYRLSCVPEAPVTLGSILDDALSQQNPEYAARRKSLRLGVLQVRAIPPAALSRLDSQLAARRGGTHEQYKRPCLFTEPGADDAALGMPTT